MRYRIAFIVLGFLFFAACVPDDNPMLTEISVDLKDPMVRNILKHELAQNKDSLLQYFTHPDPTYRYLAAKSFASYQIESVIPELDSLLKDPISEVKAMAAYSLGQIRSNKAEPILVEAFKSRDTSSVDNISNSRILESIGKMGSPKMLDAIVNISSYRPTDTLLLLGQVRSLYQFALRGKTNPKGTEQIIKFINGNEFPKEVRLIAAHYLARTKDIDLTTYKFQIIQALVKEEDVFIKMALALSLRKIVDPEVQTVLLDQLKLDQDYRVKCNLIKALSKQSYITGAEKMIPFLDDENLAVAQTAAQFFVQNGNKDDATVYRNLARQERHWSVNTLLYQATLKNSPYYYSKTLSATRWEILSKLNSIVDPYEKLAYIQVLGEDPGSYSELYNLLEKEENIPVRTAIFTALGQIANHPEFEQTFSSSPRYAKTKMLEYLNAGLETGDPGIIAVVGETLASDTGRFKEMIDSTTQIEIAKTKLSLPKDIEAYNALEKALANIKGVKAPILTTVTSSFDPDFNLLDEFKQAKEVIVKTSKGIFNIALFDDVAPMSVVNFLQLINDNYYDNKVFHRVVPNFVIQTGCSRGDGYSSLDYTIRSEIGPTYYNDEGYVGLASAGLHTESSQWFVTHSPTPHLDGKYTIIGKVTTGMDVVHNIQVGDTIEDIIIKII